MASLWLEPFIYFSFQLENWSNQLSAIKSHFKSHKAKKAIFGLDQLPASCFWVGSASLAPEPILDPLFEHELKSTIKKPLSALLWTCLLSIHLFIVEDF